MQQEANQECTLLIGLGREEYEVFYIIGSRRRTSKPCENASVRETEPWLPPRLEWHLPYGNLQSLRLYLRLPPLLPTKPTTTSTYGQDLQRHLLLWILLLLLPL
jgi:hypothetical protein